MKTSKHGEGIIVIEEKSELYDQRRWGVRLDHNPFQRLPLPYFWESELTAI